MFVGPFSIFIYRMEVRGLPIREQNYGFTYITSETKDIPVRKSNLPQKAACSQNNHGGYGIIDFENNRLISKAIRIYPRYLQCV